MAVTKSVTVIDMQDFSTLPQKLVNACEEWGCFRLKNHGIPLSLMSDMKDVARSLHDLPEEIKMRIITIRFQRLYPNKHGQCCFRKAEFIWYGVGRFCRPFLHPVGCISPSKVKKTWCTVFKCMINWIII